MKSFLAIVPKQHQERLLPLLQSYGGVHFKQLSPDEDKLYLSKEAHSDRLNFYENELAKVRYAISKIESLAPKKGGLLGAPIKKMSGSEYDSFLSGYDYESVYAKIKGIDDSLVAIKAERLKLILENDTLKQWIQLDVSQEELGSLKSVSCNFGTVSKVALAEFLEDMSEYETVYIESLGYVKDDEMLLVISPKDINDEVQDYMKQLGFSKLGVPHSGISKERIAENLKTLNSLNARLLTKEDEIKQTAAEFESLKICEDCLVTLYGREKVCENFLNSAAITWLEGYVPVEDSAKLKSIISSVCGEECYIEEEDVPKDSEDVPIKLKNNKIVSAFESVTEMYSLPKYSEFDPTPIFTPFYMLFFAFMIGDMGYGLLMAAATAFALKFMHLRKGSRRFMSFFFWLGVATIVVGLLFGSMFGFTVFAPISSVNEFGEAVKTPVLDSSNGIEQMLIVSLAIGFFQVVFGLCVRGALLIRDKKYWSAVFDALFWITALSGAIGMIIGAVGILPPIWGEISKWSFWLSIAGLLLTQGRSAKTIGGKIGTAIYAVYGITGFAGDLVSYTRLVALSLSGAYIAYSFNLMSGMIPAGIPRFIIGGAIFLVGQALNFGLAALGAYVHTCRLQYVEFFSKFYSGGGVKYQPFNKGNKYVEIEK